MKKVIFCLLCCSTIVFSSCYSFRGTSIPPEVSTFFVAPILLESYDVPSNLPVIMAEKLRTKIRNESRLKYTENEPDIEFQGKLTGFRVSPVAPSNNQASQSNRLEITLSVDYIDHKNIKNNWKNNFTFFQDFSSNINFLDVRDVLADKIFDQLAEDIFNRAFSNW